MKAMMDIATGMKTGCDEDVHAHPYPHTLFTNLGVIHIHIRIQSI